METLQLKSRSPLQAIAEFNELHARLEVWRKEHSNMRCALNHQKSGFTLVFQNVGNDPITNVQDRETRDFVRTLGYTLVTAVLTNNHELKFTLEKPTLETR